MTPSGSSHRLYWILGIGLLVSYAYFYQAGGWNQNSRFALVRAMTERNTLAIDGFHESTGDRAVWRGHFYSDKAPGVSLTAVIPVEAVRILNLAAGTDPDSDAAITRTSYVATVVVSGLFTVVAALCVAWLSLSWGYSRGAALFAATTYSVATPAWCYATLFMGHGLAAGCLMIAFTAAVALRDASGARANRLSWAIGLFAGWAVVSEFQAAVPVLLITVLAYATSARSSAGANATRRVMTRVVVGGAIAGAMLVAYNTAAFGSPFHLGYASEEGFEQLQTGLFGISTPRLWRLREILFGNYRGLLPLSPLMALTPFGLALLARTRSRAWPAVVAATIVGYYLVLNASYFYWEGGWSFGPRQIMTAMPFFALGLAPLWDGWPAAGRIVLAIAWLWGAALTLVAVSTTPQPPGAVERPVTQLLLPAFRDGRLALNTQRFTDLRPDDAGRSEDRPPVSWNLGMKMGLTGLPSLIPLGIIWLACAAGLARTLPNSSPRATRGSA